MFVLSRLKPQIDKNCKVDSASGNLYNGIIETGVFTKMFNVVELLQQYPALEGIVVGIVTNMVQKAFASLDGKQPDPNVKSALMLVLPVVSAIVSGLNLYLQGKLGSFDAAAFANLLQVLLGSVAGLHAAQNAAGATTTVKSTVKLAGSKLVKLAHRK